MDNTKRSTPQSKETSIIRDRHNSVILNTSIMPSTSGSGLRSRRGSVNLNTSAMPGIIRSGTIPFFKTGSSSQLFKKNSSWNLNSTIGTAAVDNDTQEESDSAYNAYLLSLMKREIVSKVVKQYDQDIKDQLAVKKDNLHKTKMALKKMKQEIDNSETLYQLNELTDCLLENVNNCLKLNDDYDLIHTLKKILALLESMCSKVQVKNFKSVSDQESVDKLRIVLEKCVNNFKKLDSSIRPIESINKLGELIKQYQGLVSNVTESQSLLNKQHINETSKLFKSISDMYAQNEN